MHDSVVLFDLDGVLVDSRETITGSMNHALAAHGFPVRPQAELHRFVGPPLHHTFGELTGHPRESELVASCVRTYRERYAQVYLDATPAMPGIPAALRALAPRHRLGVATSKALAFAEPLLEALGLRALFAVVAGPDLSPRPEDKTATVGAALDALDARAGAMVGDRSFDIVAARAHGLVAIGVAWGFGTRAELEQAGAEHIVATPAELVGLLGG